MKKLSIAILAALSLSAAAQENKEPIDSLHLCDRISEFVSLSSNHLQEMDFDAFIKSVSACPELAKCPVARFQTLRIVKELADLKAYAKNSAGNLDRRIWQKSALDSRSQNQIEKDESDRMKKACSARGETSGRTISSALAAIKSAPVSIPADADFILLMAGIEKKFEDEKSAAAREKELKASMQTIEITQVVKEGALVTFPNSDYKRGFLTGPFDSNLAEGQRYTIPLERDGTFSYTTVLGAPSTIEKWKIIEKK